MNDMAQARQGFRIISYLLLAINWWVFFETSILTHMLICLMMMIFNLQNKPDHFKFAFKVWNNSVKDHQLTQSMNFLSMLAINLAQPQTALDILPKPDKHFSSMNVRLLALLECGHIAEIFETIKGVLTEEQYKNFRISENVVRNEP